jgi:hypothetical protein
MHLRRAPLGGVLVVVLMCAGHAFAQASFDIKTVDPETFRAIAVKISRVRSALTSTAS